MYFLFSGERCINSSWHSWKWLSIPYFPKAEGGYLTSLKKSPLERLLLNQSGLSQRHGEGAPLPGERDFNSPFLIKSNIHLPNSPVILLLGVNSREMKTHVCSKTCAWIHIAAFIHDSLKLNTTQIDINKWRNEPIEPIVYVLTMEFYNAIKGMDWKHIQQHGWVSQ